MTTTNAREQVRPGTPDHSPRRGLAAFAAINAFSAWGGAIALITGSTDFGDRLNRRLPFESVVLAGVALAVVVAVPLSVLAWLAWRGDTRAGRAAVLTGVVLVGWIAVQLVFLRAFSGFQPVYVVIGCVLIATGRRH